LISTIDESKKIVHTSNSIYKLIGTGQYLITPAIDIKLIRQGLSPDEIFAVQNLNKMKSINTDN